VLLRDQDGQRKAIARHSVIAVSETDGGGSLLLLSGGRMVQVEERLDVVVEWFC
jgi:hypothetical protein